MASDLPVTLATFLESVTFTLTALLVAGPHVT